MSWGAWDVSGGLGAGAMRRVGKSVAVAALVTATGAGLAFGTAAAGPPPVEAVPVAVAPVAAPAPAIPASATLTPTGAGVPVAAASAAAAAGTLRDVALTAADGTAVAGSYSPDRRTWTASAPLAYGTTYTWGGSLVADSGPVTPLAGSVTTVAPKKFAKAVMNVEDGQTVGIAAPIELRFPAGLDDAAKAAVERNLTVTTSVPVEGAWAWVQDDWSGSRVHWRPKDYWPPHTQVSVAAALYGLDLGKAGYGRESVTRSFTIGRSQIVKADEDSHRVVVIRDGRQVFDFPASYGLETDPRRVTRSGVHIVMAKAETVLMSNPDYGYEDLPEHWAVRISNNGEFLHANPASASAQGKRNVSHGCVNMSTKDARAYFDTAIYGDPVEVTGSSVPLSAADGDVYDWTVPWETWTSMSALAG